MSVRGEKGECERREECEGRKREVLGGKEGSVRGERREYQWREKGVCGEREGRERGECEEREGSVHQAK